MHNQGLIKYTYSSDREFIEITSFASLLGAIAEVGYDDIVINGFTNEEGIGSPSSTHARGINGDLRYLNKSKTNKRMLITDPDFDENRQNLFNDALNKFGFTSLVTSYYGSKKDKLLKYGKYDSNGGHKDHLHIQGYKPELEIQ
ncbi:hypothetical protein LVD15_11260 [Fulvivirga maritima]|uniref:hypothetical protein n=1 Tax=Fulvivirga maritima TaxID=2904247 RepID=UPI001F48811A|nr:hypothetical protein [Fulvivirga maritima]UII28975.1 hypothetical protein LVD15_11260 [Fulvivirga maritima]